MAIIIFIVSTLFYFNLLVLCSFGLFSYYITVMFCLTYDFIILVFAVILELLKHSRIYTRTNKFRILSSLSSALILYLIALEAIFLWLIPPAMIASFCVL